MKRLDLWCCGVPSHGGRFGVSVQDEDGWRSVWYGGFGKFDKHFDGSLMSAGIAAAYKAQWVGCKVAEGMGIPLRVAIHHSGFVPLPYARKMTYAAGKRRITLFLREVSAGEENDAVRLCRDVAGFQKYDLALAARFVQPHRYIGSDR